MILMAGNAMCSSVCLIRSKWLGLVEVLCISIFYTPCYLFDPLCMRTGVVLRLYTPFLSIKLIIRLDVREDFTICERIDHSSVFVCEVVIRHTENIVIVRHMSPSRERA